MSKSVWVIARPMKAGSFFGSHQYLARRLYRNHRLNYLAFAAGGSSTVAVFKHKNEALDFLYNKWQKHHDLPCDFKPVRRKVTHE